MASQASLVFDRATPADLAERLKQLDPGSEYRVVIQKLGPTDRTADLRPLFARAQKEASTEGRTEADIMDEADALVTAARHNPA